MSEAPSGECSLPSDLIVKLFLAKGKAPISDREMAQLEHLAGKGDDYLASQLRKCVALQTNPTLAAILRDRITSIARGRRKTSAK